jgi:DEAD/DEAH box helicase domain-containing protein
MKPIVVFTDGYAFHEDRIDDDSAQRMAIVKSGNYTIWSLTWEDVAQFDNKKPTYKYENYLDEKHINVNQFKKMYKSSASFLNNTSMELLVDLLTTQSLDMWLKRAEAISTCMIKPKPYGINDKTLLDSLSDELYEDLIDDNKKYFAGKYDDVDISILSLAEFELLKTNVFSKNISILHLKDKFTKIDFKSWAGIIRMYNLLQFLPYSFFTTTKALEKNLYDAIDFDLKPQSRSSDDWKFIYEEVLDEAKELVRSLSKHTDIPLPNVGEELTDINNTVVCEAELIWDEFNIAVTLEENIVMDEWTIFNISEEERLIETLQKRINS